MLLRCTASFAFVCWSLLRPGVVIEPEYSRDRFAVTDRTVHDHFHGCGHGNEPKADNLVRLGLSGPSAKSGGEKYRHGLGDESWAGVELENAAPAGMC